MKMMKDTATNVSSNNKHWGEFFDECAEDSDDGELDVGFEIDKAMNFNVEEFEFTDEFNPKLEIITLPMVDPLVTQAIQLHKYANKLRTMIATNDCSLNLFDEKYTDLYTKPKIRRLQKNIVNYIPKQYTDFARGVETEFPTLSTEIVKEILKKSVATLFAQIGYETGEQGTLDVMTDVLEEFYKKMSLRVSIVADDATKGQLNGFPNIIERVLTETGMGGVRGINDYYQSRVIKYIKVLQERCRELEEHYKNISVPMTHSPSDKFNKHVKVKVEEENDIVEVENQEVQFAALDSDLNLSILETGFQLLNSLEAETNLQGLLETEDEGTNSPAGSVALTSEGDVSHLSPYSKRKRLK